MITHRSSFTPLETETRYGPSRSLTGFTLIELLIVIAVIAILAVAVILVLNPVELLREGRDATRLSDMNTLNQSILLYQEDVGGSLGSASTTYFSIPDPQATSTLGDHCEGLGLSAPAGWSYHCAASSTVKNVDGTGWIPINFKQISFGHPIGALPVDPTNTSSSGLYYTYVAGSYALTATMESQKYLTKAQNDGGYDPSRYETGSDLSLVAKSEGLVGWWTFDEGSGSTAKDSSGNGNDGTLQGADPPTWTTSGCERGDCLSFDGTDDWVSAGQSLPSNTTSPFTLMAWMNPAGSATYRSGVSTVGSLAEIAVWNGQNCFNRDGGGGWSICDATAVTDGTWYFVVGVYDGTKASLYVNGTLKSGPTAESFAVNHGATVVGSYTNGGAELWDGEIDDVRVYSRALSPAEIQNIYNAEK